MKSFLGGTCVLLFSALVARDVPRQIPERLVKIAEGEYRRREGGHPIKDTTQSSALWRTKDGFEIESKLPPDKGALLLAAMGHRPFKHESAELIEEARNAATATEINVALNMEMNVSTLHVAERVSTMRSWRR